jgi:hypothetical protein
VAIDWDQEVLAPVMGVFGEGLPEDPESWPLYAPVRGQPFRLQDAVFDREYADVTLEGDGAEVTTKRPMLGVRLSLFPPGEPQQNALVFVPSCGERFVVRDVRPDGHGHAKLMLMLAA